MSADRELAEALPSSNIVVTATSPIAFTEGELVHLWYADNIQNAVIWPARQDAENTKVAVLLAASQKRIAMLIATRLLKAARQISCVPNLLNAGCSAYVCSALISKIEGDVIILEPQTLE